MKKSTPENALNTPDDIESPRSCLWRLLSVVVWMLLALALAVFGFRVWFQSTLDKTRRTAMEKFDSEIVTLPPDWQTAAKMPSKELIEFHKRFFHDMERLAGKYPGLLPRGSTTTTDSIVQKLQRHDVLTSAEQTLVDDFIVDFQPIVDLTSAGVSLPDYTASVYSYVKIMRFFNMRDLARGASVMALDLARRGHCKQAMRVAILPMRYMRRDPRSMIILHLLGVGVTNISAETFFALAEQCDDPAALRIGLELLDGVRNVAQPKYVDLWEYGDWASALAAAKAAGYPVDLSPQPLAGYYRQYFDVLWKPYSEWVVENLPPGDPRVNTAKQHLKELESSRRSASWNERFLQQTLVRYRGLAPVVFGYSAEALAHDAYTVLVASYRAKVASTRYNLARLRLAQRLAELEGAAAPIGPGAVNSYLGAVPVDPYSPVTSGTAAQLLFSAGENRFYGRGPDKDDDAMKVYYDATNGTDSNGDVYIHP